MGKPERQFQEEWAGAAWQHIQSERRYSVDESLGEGMRMRGKKMGLMQFIREKLGADSEMLDSAVLTKALDETLQEIKELDSKIVAREQRLGFDSI
jgi:hypothetical protein